MSPSDNSRATARMPAPASDGAATTDGIEMFGWLPCQLTLEIPAAGFTIGDLIKLEKGSVVETAFHHSSDIPLRVNKQLIAWTEFEVVGDNLAVRVTELA